MNNRPIRACFIKTVKKNKLLSTVVALTVILSVAFSVLPPLALERAVNELTASRTLNVKTAVLYFVLIALGGITDAVRGVFITAFGQKVTTALRREMCEKLSRLPAGYFITSETGKTVARFTGDVDAVETIFRSGIISIVIDAFKIVAILIMIFTRSTGLGVLMLAAIPTIIVITSHFRKKMHSAQMENRRAVAKINNHFPETLESIVTVHNLNKEAYMQKLFREYVAESYRASEKSNFYDAIYTPIICEMSVLVIAAMMTLSALGGGMQAFFGMTVGTAVAVLNYVEKIYSPIENLGTEIQNVQSAIAGIKRVEEFLLEKEKGERPVKNMEEFDFTAPAISFDDVTFGYGEKTVLRGVSFSIGRGDSVAFVGRTGAGKTTVYRLILGLYAPESGSAKIFGKEASLISESLKRKLFGYIDQSVRLMHGSIRDQIALEDDEITDEEVEKAIETVGLTEAVKAAGGIHAFCREEAFSQGQKQLLTVARAICYDPEILLLDEITANLDSETEKEIAAAVRRAAGGRTVINISHRLGDVGKNTRIIEISPDMGRENVGREEESSETASEAASEAAATDGERE